MKKWGRRSDAIKKEGEGRKQRRKAGSADQRRKHFHTGEGGREKREGSSNDETVARSNAVSGRAPKR